MTGRAALDRLRRWATAEADRLSRNYSRHHQRVDMLRAGIAELDSALGELGLLRTQVERYDAERDELKARLDTAAAVAGNTAGAGARFVMERDEARADCASVYALDWSELNEDCQERVLGYVRDFPTGPLKPCFGCGSRARKRSACPDCGKVLCRPCAEAPSDYASCCDTPDSAGVTPCRECSGCCNLGHHWLDRGGGPDEPEYICKHCEAVGDECENCDDSSDIECWCHGTGVVARERA